MKVFRRRYGCGTLHCLVPFFPHNLVTVFVWSNLVLNGFFKKGSASLTGVPLEKKGHQYWLLAIRAARKACLLRRQADGEAVEHS